MSYLLQRELGQGLDGKTWLAKKKESSKSTIGKRTKTARSYFCIKQFPILDGKFESVKHGLSQEIAVMKLLSTSQYLLWSEEIVRTENNCWLVMEFCNGGSLQELIRAHKEGLSQQVLRNLMFQITSALAELESKNLLQVDLKPNNIMLHHKQSDHRLSRNDFYKILNN